MSVFILLKFNKMYVTQNAKGKLNLELILKGFQMHLLLIEFNLTMHKTS